MRPLWALFTLITLKGKVTLHHMQPVHRGCDELFHPYLVTLDVCSNIEDGVVEKIPCGTNKDLVMFHGGLQVIQLLIDEGNGGIGGDGEVPHLARIISTHRKVNCEG